MKAILCLVVLMASFSIASEVRWQDSANFGGCSKSCGAGSQSKARQCVDNENGDVYVNYEALDKCGVDTGSPEVQECNTWVCGVYYYVWEDSYNFGSCSSTCGGGTQSKTRKCMIQPDNYSANFNSQCGTDYGVAATQDCNTFSCTMYMVDADTENICADEDFEILLNQEECENDVPSWFGDTWGGAVCDSTAAFRGCVRDPVVKKSYYSTCEGDATRFGIMPVCKEIVIITTQEVDDSFCGNNVCEMNVMAIRGICRETERRCIYDESFGPNLWNDHSDDSSSAFLSIFIAFFCFFCRF